MYDVSHLVRSPYSGDLGRCCKHKPRPKAEGIGPQRWIKRVTQKPGLKENHHGVLSSAGVLRRLAVWPFGRGPRKSADLFFRYAGK